MQPISFSSRSRINRCRKLQPQPCGTNCGISDLNRSRCCCAAQEDLSLLIMFDALEGFEFGRVSPSIRTAVKPFAQCLRQQPKCKTVRAKSTLAPLRDQPDHSENKTRRSQASACSRLSEVFLRNQQLHLCALIITARP